MTASPTALTAGELRAELASLFDRAGGPLIITHRGTTLGSFPDNTVRAAIATQRSGADIVEVDVDPLRRRGVYLLPATATRRSTSSQAPTCAP